MIQILSSSDKSANFISYKYVPDIAYLLIVIFHLERKKNKVINYYYYYLKKKKKP